MAFLRLPADLGPFSTDDPWYWGVDKVVATLCDFSGPMLRGVDPLSIPDRAFLENALRENAISGPTLLTELTHPVLRDDLGLKPLGHRTTLMHVIMDLRRQSARYLHHLQTNNAMSYPAGYGKLLNMGQPPQLVPPSLGAPFPQRSPEETLVSENQSSPFIPTVHGPLTGSASVQNRSPPDYQSQPFYEPPTGSFQAFGWISPDRQDLQGQASITGNEGRLIHDNNAATLEGGFSTINHRAHSSEIIGIPAPQSSRADSVHKIDSPLSDIGRQGETVIIDENGKKRRRLVLAPVEPDEVVRENIPPAAEGRSVSVASGEKHSFLEIDHGQASQSPTKEPMEQSGPSTPTENKVHEPAQPEMITTILPKENDGAGTITVDERGRKRMKPVLITLTEHENSAMVGKDSLESSTGLNAQLLAPSSERLDLKADTRQNKLQNLCPAYLGAEPLSVDKLFYSDTKIGQEVNHAIKYNQNWRSNDGDNLENFAFVGADFGNGQRRYVNTRIRHMLYSRSIRVVRRRGEILVVQVLYPDSLGKKHHQLSVTVYSKSSDGIIASRMDRSWFSHRETSRERRDLVEEDPDQPNAALVETDWDYLKKWDFKAGEEKVLPVYGDSGSENEYDLDTWLEMEEEKGGKIPRPFGRSTRKKIDSIAVELAIVEAMEQIVEHWIRVKEPKLLSKAWRIWKKARKDGTSSDQIGALTCHIQHLDTRLSNIRKEILREGWSSTKEVIKQCKSMEESIFDREACKCRVLILKLRAVPEKPPSVARKPKKTRREISQIPTGDSGEDIVSKDSASEWTDDEWDNFIIDDGADEENVGYVDEDVAPALGVPHGQRVSEISDLDADEGNIGYVDEDVAPALGVPHGQRVSDISDPDVTDPSSEGDGTESGEIKDESPSVGQAALVEARRKNVIATLRNRQLNPSVEVIDLTQLSESGEMETHLERSSPVQTPSMDFTVDENPTRQRPAKSAGFERPPLTPSIIHIDSDSAEYSTAREDISISPPNLPEYGEVEKISQLNWEVLVERKDRKRLLIWIIHHARSYLRDRVIGLMDKNSFEDIEETIRVALKGLIKEDLKIRGMSVRESETWMLLGAWYVSWTIPVKVNADLGILRSHIRTAYKDQKGLLPFYEFLNKCLVYYEQKKTTENAVLNSKGQLSEKPKRRELRDGSDDNFDSPTPRKKRKYAVPESQETINLRRKAQERVNERNIREERNMREKLKRRFKEIGPTEEDSSMAVVNPGKLDEQAFICINPKISSKMQAHQKEGVQFMWREVVTDHQGCLLAQTMGLGKTMQVITLLVTIAEAATSPDENIRNQVPKDLYKLRALILCPPALVENWWEEFVMWTPSTSTYKLGAVRKVTATIKIEERLQEIETWKDDGGVLLLGFNSFRDLVLNRSNKVGNKLLDTDQHQAVEDALLNKPNLIVADEAHFVKGLSTGINKAINQLKSMNRIALTGSPLANNLEEYHSLIDWIAPNYLGTRIEFKANYGERIQEGLYQDSTSSQYRESLKLLEVLKTELQPKVHRADITVLRGKLKEKQEFVIRVPLTQLQTEIYKIYVDTMLTVSRVNEPQSATMWAWLSTLRLLCNHPKCFQNRLLSKNSASGEVQRRGQKSENEKAHSKKISHFDAVEEADNLVDAPISEIGISQSIVERQLAPFNDLAEPHDSIALSNKMQILMEIIRFSKEVHDKVLVFSHSLHTLNYVEDKLQERNAVYSRIDGGVLTTSRQKISKEFNAGNIEVCLISTRAGGQGLNLFGANRVVILDDHFNPMWEEQAVGRAYRIGQKKAVFVYHLMAGGTFEELLHNQSVFKQQLARRVVDKKNPARYALRKIGEYLFHPKKVEQKDLGQFRGKDPRVLERILNRHEDDPIIRSMDFTETFHQEDTIALTEEEKKEAEQLQKDERLRRSDPIAYSDMIAKRNKWTQQVALTTPTLQAFNPAFDSPGQGFPHFNSADQLAEQRSHFFSLAAMTTGKQFPFLDRAAVPLMPESRFSPASAATSPGWPPKALAGTQFMPIDLSERCSSAPPSSANSLVPIFNEHNGTPNDEWNKLAATIGSHVNSTCLSPILSASTAMIPYDPASPEKQINPMTSSMRPPKTPDDSGVLSPSTTGILCDPASPENQINPATSSMRPPKTPDDSGDSSNLKSRRSHVSRPTLNLSPYPPLHDLLRREAARMSKDRPSSNT